MSEHQDNQDNQDSQDDDSFIILGSSAGSSLDVNCNVNEEIPLEEIDGLLLENGAFKAHFKLGPSPSPSSLMAASVLVTDDKTIDELQKQFGEIIDENQLLKDSLKRNNESIKEQFLMISTYQEDMMKTHEIHKEKFEQTKAYIEKLRAENASLKSEVARLSESSCVNCETGEFKFGPASPLEFVSSPDDDTINKLTAQLELVEKQRREVISDNEKLTWQKESLEHIIDATSKDRDDLRQKVQALESELFERDTEHAETLKFMRDYTEDLEKRLHFNVDTTALTEIANKESIIEELNAKLVELTRQLETVQMKACQFENLKLEFIQYKSAAKKSTLHHSEQLNSLKQKLKNTQTVVFQPAAGTSADTQHQDAPENPDLQMNVQLYDRTVKHLADYLNMITHGLSDTLMELYGLVSSLCDFQLDLTNTEQFMEGLNKVRALIESQNASSMDNANQVKCMLVIFEKIFKDYDGLAKKMAARKEPKPSTSTMVLSSALIARGKEIDALQAELKEYQKCKEQVELLTTQLEFYKVAFEAEPQKTASENESSSNMVLSSALIARGQEIDALQAELKEFRACKEQVELLTNQLEFYKAAFEAEPPKTPTVKESISSTTVLSSALEARAREIEALQAQLKEHREDKEQVDLLRTQLDLYKADFEAEREARQKIASEKETAETELRVARRNAKALELTLNEVRKMNPVVFNSATSRASTSSTASSSRPRTDAPSGLGPSGTNGTMNKDKKKAVCKCKGGEVRKKKKLQENTKGRTNGTEENGFDRSETPPPLRFHCPVCDQQFKTLLILQQHVESCL